MNSPTFSGPGNTTQVPNYWVAVILELLFDQPELEKHGNPDNPGY